MKKIKEFLNEYKSLIIGLLIAFLMFKSVHFCQRINYYESELARCEYVIDSMQTEIANKNELIECKNDTLYNIHSLRRENAALKEVIVQYIK